MRCEGCGALGENVKYIDVRVTNGVLHLCQQCLDDVNRKNPKLIEAVELLAELTAPDPCQYDHNEKCQAHWLHTRPCPHERAKKLLGIHG